MQESDILAEVLRLVRLHVPATHDVVLFGSQARGTARPTSDLDVAIVGPEPVPDHTMAVLRQAVAALPTLRKVDHVDAQAVDDVLRSEILRDAKPL